VDLQFTVIFNKSQFPKAIHKEIYARAGCAYHLRQRFLAYFGNNRFRFPFLAKLRKQQQGPGQALFTGIKS